ncbi:hypothetical protein GCM10025857_36600 [Alicyclobacillus contaminans]|nr:hypothetical protein GCM10025857_36600 [Alicyclobacillus contaminans]
MHMSTLEGPHPDSSHSIVVKPLARAASQDRMNVLLLGSDARSRREPGNTDTLVLCSIDYADRRVEWLSIPRDTRVQFPDGHFGKINESLAIGGPTLTKQLTEDLTGTPVHHYVLARFDGVVQLIDALGGVTLPVEHRMNYDTGDTRFGHIHLRQGMQRLNGEQALGFLRFRHDPLGDIGRTARQRELLTALTKQLFQPTNLMKLPGITRQATQMTETDLSMWELTRLVSEVPTYQHFRLVGATLPGSFHNPDPMVPGDQSYWIVNPVQTRYAAHLLFEKGCAWREPVQDMAYTTRWRPHKPPLEK